MRAFVVQHVAFEGPAAIRPALEAVGATVQVVRADLGEPLPDPGDVGVLVVMGGPMNALDDAGHPHLAGERALLRAVAGRGVPVLGVCLGAQLLAAALGARVLRGPAPEIGTGTVRLTPAGVRDPVLGAGGDPLPVLHWHGDTFDLPDGAQLLASSEAYPHQAYRVGRAYGLQFHVELDAPAIEAARPHLPEGTVLEPATLRAIGAAGRRVLAAWAAGLASPAAPRGD